MRYRDFLLGYFALLGFTAAMVFGAYVLAGVSPDCAVLTVGGLVIVVAATGKWPALFELMRNIGWFATFQDGGVAKVVLAASGLLCWVIAFMVCMK